MTRDEQQLSGRSGNFNAPRNSDGGGNIRTKKIFVGGLPSSLTEDEFRQYFESYGHVNDAVIMYDQNTQRPRGFGFVTFDTEEAVDRVLHKTFHDVSGKQVEVKRALPKDSNPGGTSRGSGGGYSGYGGASGGASSYEGRVDSSRYMQPQNTGGGYTPYDSSAYGAGYGYGNNGVSYGGYGGYGGAGAGFGAPASAGYGTGPPAGPRASWGTQPPSGYGAMGYGNTGPWATTGNGPVAAPAGQAPGGPMGYGGQGYGYGMYGGADASYGRSGGAPNSGAGGPGYTDAAWRSDPSDVSGSYGNQANGAYGYGGGYSSGQVRQVQQ